MTESDGGIRHLHSRGSQVTVTPGIIAPSALTAAVHFMECFEGVQLEPPPLSPRGGGLSAVDRDAPTFPPRLKRSFTPFHLNNPGPSLHTSSHVPHNEKIQLTLGYVTEAG